MDAATSMYQAAGGRFFSAAAPGARGGKKRHPGKAILAGGIAGGIEICITYPTEYVKTRLHLQSEAGAVKQFNGPFDVVRKTVRAHGVTGLYRGIASLLYGSIPKSSVRFTSYETMRNLLMDDVGHLSPARTFLAGLLAGATEAVVIVAPMETIKVKFVHDQTSPNPKFKSFGSGVVSIVRSQGISGVYQGLLPTVIKQASNQAIRFSVYNPMKKLFQEHPDQDIGVIRTGICGVIAGAASVFGNTPVDVVKTRMQGLDAKTKYKNTFDCVKQLWAEGGPTAMGKLRVFYKGTTPRLGRVCADVALVFIIYEQVMKVLDRVYPTPEY